MKSLAPGQPRLGQQGSPPQARHRAPDRSGFFGQAFVWTLCVLVCTNLLSKNKLIPAFDIPGVAATFSLLALALSAALVLMTFRDKLNWINIPSSVILGILLWNLFRASFTSGSFEPSDYIGLLICIAVLVGLTAAARQPRWQSAIAGAMVACIIIDSSICIWEFFFHANFFSTAPGRAAGLFQNPNIASLAITGCFTIYMSHVSIRQEKYGLLLAALFSLAVFCTFSRAGYVASIFIIGLFVFEKYGRRNLLFFVIATALVGITGFVALKFAASSINLSDDAYIRVNSFLTAFGESDFSTRERARVAELAWLMVQTNPWGYGPGTVQAMTIGPHNMYLAIAVDHGVIVAALYFLLWIWVGWRAFWGGGDHALRLFWVWWGIWNLSSHNLFDPIGLAILGLALGRSQTSSPTQIRGKIHGAKLRDQRQTFRRWETRRPSARNVPAGLAEQGLS